MTPTSLQRPARPLWRRLTSLHVVLILAGTCLAGPLCYLVLSQGGDWPPYRTKATLLIDRTPDSVEAGPSVESIGLAQETIAALVVREPMISEVNQELDLGLDSEELVSHLRIERPERTPIVEIVATHPDPEVAARIANAVATRAAELRSPLVGVSVLSTAPVPTRPVLSAYLLVAVAALLGGLVATGAVALRREGPVRIEGPWDVVEQTDLELLGELDIGRGEASSNQWLIAKIINRLQPGERNIIFTSPGPIRSKEAFFALQAQIMRHMLEDETLHHVALEREHDTTSDRLQTRVKTFSGGGVSAEIPLGRWLSDLAAGSAECEAGAADRHEPSQTNGETRGQETGPTNGQGEGGAKGEAKGEANGGGSWLTVIDGPPVLANFHVLSRVARYAPVVLVLEQDVTTTTEAKEAHDLIDEADIRLLGAILIS
jgi:capsular polysaccharide biosynthesis protein